MVDNSSEMPKVQDFSGNPRKQTRFYGQKSAVAPINKIDDRIDLKRLDEIDKDPIVLELMDGEPMSISDLREWAEGTKDQILFSIRGSGGVDSDEIGELQGWVQFYSPNSETISSLSNAGVKIDETPLVFEVSYAKLPEAAEGQISAGLRQSILQLPKELEKRGFSEEEVYDKKLEIFAYVDPVKNKSSVKVLESAGFAKAGEGVYPGEKGLNDIYLLNLDVLHERLNKGVFMNNAINEAGQENSHA